MRSARGLACSSLVVLLLSGACGGGDDESVDIVGDTPEEAADELAEAGCDKQVECGIWQLDIDLDEQGNVTACTVVGKLEVVQSECVAERAPQLQEILECSMLTDDEAGMLNECYNDLLAQDCIAEDEVVAYCDALENGEDVEEPGAQPASCDVLTEIFQGCAGTT